VTAQIEPERTALLAQQQTLQTQLNSLSNARILNNADPSVVAPATAQKSSSLSGLVVYAFGGLLLGLLVGLAVGLLLDRRYGRIRKEGDVAMSAAVVPFVVAVAPATKERGAVLGPADVTRTYRRVAGELMHREDPGSTYMIASVGTTVRSSEASSGLAESVAAMGWSVGLIDTDLDGPALEREFGTDLAPGLSELLDDEGSDPAGVDFPKVGPEAGITLVPAGVATDTSRIRLLGPRLPAVVESFAERSRMVLLRAPSQDSVGTAVLTGIADAVVVVGVLRQTLRRDLEDAVQEFAAAGLPIAGILLLSPERPPGDGPVGVTKPGGTTQLSS
jgi:Mrp family chromosome partitioning ATPase